MTLPSYQADRFIIWGLSLIFFSILSLNLYIVCCCLFALAQSSFSSSLQLTHAGYFAPLSLLITLTELLPYCTLSVHRKQDFLYFYSSRILGLYYTLPSFFLTCIKFVHLSKLYPFMLSLYVLCYVVLFIPLMLVLFTLPICQALNILLEITISTITISAVKTCICFQVDL